MQLDEKWIRVNLMHDVLRKIGDVDLVDKSRLHLRNKNCPNHFWSMLELMREIISYLKEALA